MASDAQRSLAAGIGALSRWSRIHGADARRDATAAARAALRSKWEQQAEAEAGRVLSPAELKVAVELLRRAHYKRMALASARKRSRKAAR